MATAPAQFCDAIPALSSGTEGHAGAYCMMRNGFSCTDPDDGNALANPTVYPGWVSYAAYGLFFEPISTYGGCLEARTQIENAVGSANVYQWPMSGIRLTTRLSGCSFEYYDDYVANYNSPRVAAYFFNTDPEALGDTQLATNRANFQQTGRTENGNFVYYNQICARCAHRPVARTPTPYSLAQAYH